MAVAGASRYLGAATLANTKGLAAQAPSLLDNGSSTLSLLDAGRGNAVRGIGLSPSARALNNQFLNSSSTINTLFSFSAATGASTDAETAIKQIQALRAATPDSQLSRAALAQKYGIDLDSGNINPPSRGQSVNQQA